MLSFVIMKKVAVIGSGIAGIAAAIRLAAKGYSVEVFEKNAGPGGKLSEFSLGAFRFDAGPSLFTMPHFVDELFHLFGENPRDYFRYQQIDPVCRYFYPDGTCFDAPATPELLAREISNATGEKEAEILRFLRKSKRLYQLTARFFIYGSFHRCKDFLNREFLRQLIYLPEYEVFSTMEKSLRTRFSDPRVVQFFSRYATYNGSNPYTAPATLHVIPSLENEFGAFLPEKGMYDITRQLVKLAERHGVVFHYNAPVTKIQVENRQAKGIVSADTFVPTDIVISNIDVYFTYRDLLSLPEKATAIARRERSSSALVFNWGMDKTFPALELHNVFFSKHYRQEFDHIFRQHTVSEDPTVYLFISAKKIPGDAPAGSENWFTMINVPANRGQDWEIITRQARENVIRKLETMLQTPVRPHIQAESILDPVKMEAATGSFMGSLYGTSSNSKMAAFRRHANFSPGIHRLYFTGGSVHPGGGIPLCLSGAKIMAGLIPSA